MNQPSVAATLQLCPNPVQPVRWGVLGVSEMVGRLAVLPSLQRSPLADFVAVASREIERARTEAGRFGARRFYGSYAELLADPDVEAVYAPLPNALHKEWTLKALLAGKHVLCEKPLACSAVEAREMIAAARQADRTLMEAHMTTFHHRYRAALELIENGSLGDLRHIRSQFTFMNHDLTNHRWLPELGGGSLLDVGVYCLDPLLELAGEPERVQAKQVLASSGVDSTFSAWCEFRSGLTASVLTSFELPEEQRLEVIGTSGRFDVKVAFTAGSEDVSLTRFDADGSFSEIETGGNDSYLEMIEHFALVVRGDAPLQRPVETSIRCLDLIDRLRSAAQKV